MVKRRCQVKVYLSSEGRGTALKTNPKSKYGLKVLVL